MSTPIGSCTPQPMYNILRDYTYVLRNSLFINSIFTFLLIIFNNPPLESAFIKWSDVEQSVNIVPSIKNLVVLASALLLSIIFILLESGLIVKSFSLSVIKAVSLDAISLKMHLWNPEDVFPSHSILLSSTDRLNPVTFNNDPVLRYICSKTTSYNNANPSILNR